MRVGKLRDKVTFLKPCVVTDDYGDEKKEYKRWLTVSAETIYKGARQFEDFNQTNADIDYIFRIRYVKGINPLMRLHFNGNDMDIHAAIPENNHKKTLMIHCKERLSG